MRSLGYNTTNRRIIIDYLGETKNDATVEEIYNHIVASKKKVNITTVYRCLNRLERNGFLVKSFSDDGNKACYRLPADKEEASQMLLRCSSCGKTIPLDGGLKNEIIGKLSRRYAFELNSVGSFLLGICRECQNK